MNWTFKSVSLPVPGVREFIGMYRDILVDGIEFWLSNFKPETKEQSGEFFAEFPEGFCRDEKAQPVAYRYTFSTGFCRDGKYYRTGSVPYNITIERATSADYASELGVKDPQQFRPRVRYIQNMSSIS